MHRSRPLPWSHRAVRSPAAPAVALALALAACGGGSPVAPADVTAAPAAKPRLAFVTNNVGPFWTLAKHGVNAAAKEFDVDVSFQEPAGGEVTAQQQILQALLARSTAGIAVSPIDPANMTGLLDEVASRALLVTHDSDAPASKRLCYVGMVNYEAGRACGALIREAIPQGGPVVLLVGNLDQDNARGRRQGIIDELLGRAADPKRFDAQDAALKGERYEIRATFTDQTDRSKGKAAIQDALARWSDLACIVGLFEYEPPLILEAVRSAGRLGKIAMVAFDENDQTLQGILDGHIHGTIVQNPYEYGYRSIELLARLVREPDAHERAALLPKDRFLNIPVRPIRKAEVPAFWADLKQKTGRQ